MVAGVSIHSDDLTIVVDLRSKGAIVCQGIVEGGVGSAAVCAENLDPAIVVMKPAEERMRLDASDPLNRAREGRVPVQ